MNKWMRGILYIAAGCIGIGSAALILGLALGRGKVDAKDYGSLNFVKNSAYNIVVKMEDMLRGWIGRDGSGQGRDVSDTEQEDAVFYHGYEMDPDGDGSEETKVRNKNGAKGLLNVGAVQIERLDIELAHGYLEIFEGDTDQIWVGTDDDIEGISVSCEGEDVVIRDHRSGSGRREDVNIYMEIPSDVRFDEVNIQMGAGVLEIEEPLAADRMTLHAEAGEITADRLQAEEFAAEVGTGVMQINKCIFSGNVRLDCGVGQMEVYEALFEADADISCGMGTIDIEMKDGINKADYKVNCGLGSVDIGDRSFSALSHAEYIDNNSSGLYTINCGMGTISIF